MLSVSLSWPAWGLSDWTGWGRTGLLYSPPTRSSLLCVRVVCVSRKLAENVEKCWFKCCSHTLRVTLLLDPQQKDQGGCFADSHLCRIWKYLHAKQGSLNKKPFWCWIKEKGDREGFRWVFPLLVVTELNPLLGKLFRKIPTVWADPKCATLGEGRRAPSPVSQCNVWRCCLSSVATQKSEGSSWFPFIAPAPLPPGTTGLLEKQGSVRWQLRLQVGLVWQVWLVGGGPCRKGQWASAMGCRLSCPSSCFFFPSSLEAIQGSLPSLHCEGQAKTPSYR